MEATCLEPPRLRRQASFQGLHASMHLPGLSFQIDEVGKSEACQSNDSRGEEEDTWNGGGGGGHTVSAQ